MAFNALSIARAVTAALLFGASAQATILNEYSSLSAWNAATTGQVTQNFTTASNSANYSSSGITLNSVNYLGFYNESSTPQYETFRWANPSAGFNTGTGSILLGGANANGTGVATPDSGMQVTLLGLPGINALSFDFSAWRSILSSPVYSSVLTPINLTLQVYEGGSLTDTRTLTVPTGTPGLGFYGFTTTGTISSIRLLISTPLGTDANRIALDNFAYAEASGGAPPTGGDIPEPSTYLLCGAALVAGVSLRRKLQ